jgi:hypothetical protein
MKRLLAFVFALSAPVARITGRELIANYCSGARRGQRVCAASGHPAKRK